MPISPLEAALELRRRGRPLPPNVLRLIADHERQKFHGEHTGDISILPDRPAPAGYEGTTFRFEDQGQVRAPASPSTGASPPSAPLMPSHGGMKRFGLPKSEQVLLPPRPVGSPIEQETASILEEQDAIGSTVWRSLTPDERLDAARKIAANRAASGRLKGPSNEMVVQQALGRLEGEAEGSFQYDDPQMRAIDEQLAQMYARGQTVGAEARSMGPISNALLQFGSSASFGLGPLIRNQFQPNLTGLETAATQEVGDRYGITGKASTVIGQLAGAATGVSGAAKIAAGRLAGYTMARTGGVAAAEKLIAGGLGRGASAAAQKTLSRSAIASAGAAGVGGFVAGELAQAPYALGQTIGQGGSFEQALEAAGEAIAAYPLLIGKIASGEHLDENDALDLVMLIPEYLGARADILHAIDAGRPLNARYRQTLIDALKEKQLSEPSPEEIARMLAPSERGGMVETQLADEPDAAGQAFAGGRDIELVDRMGGIEDVGAFPGQPTKQYMTEMGHDVQIEALPDGTFRWTLYDPSTGEPMTTGTQANATWATRMANQTSAGLADQRLPGEPAPPDLGRIDALDPESLPATPDIGDISESFSSRITPDRSLRADFAEQYRKPKMIPLIEDDAAKAAAARQKEPAEPMRPKEKAKARKAIKSGEEVGKADVLKYIDQFGESSRPISDLVADEPHVVVDVPIEQVKDLTLGGTIEEQIARGDLSQQKLDRSRAATGDAPPIVGAAEGQSLLTLDGTHRLAVARERGDKTIRALVPKAWAEANLGGGAARPAEPPSAGGRSELEADVRRQRQQIDELETKKAREGLTDGEEADLRGLEDEFEPPENRSDKELRSEGFERRAVMPDAKKAKGYAKRWAEKNPDLEVVVKGTSVWGRPREDFDPEPPPAAPRPKKARVRTPAPAPEETPARPQEAPAEGDIERLRAKIGLLERKGDDLDEAGRVDLEASRQRLAELEGQKAESVTGLVERVEKFLREGPDPKATAKYLEDLSDADLETLRGAFKSKPRFGKVIRREITAREGGPDGVAFSSRGPSKAGPARAESGRGAPTQSARTPRTAKPAPSGKVGAVRQRAQAARAGRALRDPDSPHRILETLNRKLGLAPHGVGKSRMLTGKASQVLGFYRVAPESIRLRLADALDTHIHEIGHHIHKRVFQEGITVRTRGPKGRRKTASGLDPDMIPDRWHDELIDVADATGAKGPRVTEGWAEWVRLMFTDPDSARKLAPTVTEEAGIVLAKSHPDIWAALEEFRTRYQLYQKQHPTTKVASYIRRQNRYMPVPLRAHWDNFYTLMVDRAYPLAMMLRDIGQQALPADKNPYIGALRSFGRVTGDFDRALQHGRFDPNDPNKVKGESLDEVLRPVRAYLPEFETYMTAQRMLEKREQGKKVGGKLTTGELRQTMADIKTELEKLGIDIEEVAAKFQEFNEWLIRDYAVGHGLITAETAEKIIAKNLHYITFRNVESLAAEQAYQSVGGRKGGGGKKFSGPDTAIRRFQESLGEQIEPPLASFLGSMHAIMSRAQMNRVGQQITDLFGERPHGGDKTVEGIGRWIDAVDRPIDVMTVGTNQIVDAFRARLEALGHDGLDDGMLSELFNLMGEDTVVTLTDIVKGVFGVKKVNFFKPGIRTDPASRQFVVLKDGKPTFWEAKSDRLFDFIEGFNNPPALQGFLKLLTTPRTVLRAGATQLNPSFGLVNFARDSMQAAIYADNPRFLGVGPRAGAVKRWKAMWSAFLRGDLDQMYLASGANMSNLFGEYWDHGAKRFDSDRIFLKPADLRSLKGLKESLYTRGEWLARTAKNKGGRRLLIELAKHPAYGLESMNQRLEIANRVGEFEARLYYLTNRGKNVPTRADIEAAGQAAADITLDFHRGGTAAMQINQFVPFFNAAIQGTDRFARYIRKNKWKGFGQMLMYTIFPSFSVYMMNRDNEEYWNIAKEERDRYWHIPMGDADGDGRQEFWLLPKPYTIGSLAILADRAFAAMDGIDPTTGNRGDPEAFKGVGRSLFEQFRVPYNIPVVTPLFEMAANYSLYFRGPIVRRGEERGPVSERGAERSSNLAAAMGGLLGVEPPKIDYAIQGFFGGLGKDFNKLAIDPLLAASMPEMRGRVRAPEAVGPENWVVLRRWLSEEPRSFSENTKRFWDMWSKLEDIHGGYTRRVNFGHPDTQEYIDKHRGALEMHGRIRPYRTRLNQLYRQVKMFNTSGLSPEEVRREQNKLYDEINSVAAEAYREFLSEKKRSKDDRRNDR